MRLCTNLSHLHFKHFQNENFVKKTRFQESFLSLRSFKIVGKAFRNREKILKKSFGTEKRFRCHDHEKFPLRTPVGSRRVCISRLHNHIKTARCLAVEGNENGKMDGDEK